MTLEVYQERARELGVDRRAFAPEGQFEGDYVSTLEHAECGVDHSVSRRVAPPPIGEDLSRFVNQHLAYAKKPTGRPRAYGPGSGGARNFSDATRGFYRLLYHRTTSWRLAEALGVDITSLGHGVRGTSRTMRKRLLPLLTEAEIQLLPPVVEGKDVGRPIANGR